MAKQLEWVNRYSDTDEPDKKGRWERICYCNGLRIAVTKMVMEHKSVMFSTKTFFPYDIPYYSTTHESFKEAKECVEYQWDKLKTKIL
jgi:hypothetical protein